MRTIRILTLAALVLVCATGAAISQVQSLSFGSTPSLTVAPQRGGDLLVTVEVGELQFIDVTTPEGPFTRLVIPGFHATQEVGDPQLPVMNRLVAMPFGAEATVEILAVETRTLKLADHGIVHPLMPAQPSLFKNQDPTNVPFAYNPEAYLLGAGKSARELARVVPQGRLRALDIARLEVSPVSYDPVAGTIEVTERIDLRVTYAGADPAAGARLHAGTYSPFFEVVYDKVEGARGLHDSYPDLVADVVTYVIVTPTMFVEQLQPFIQWKTERGFRVVVGEIGSAEVGTTAATIQSFIHGLYNTATPELPAPSFVLFVGDVAQCPTFQMSGDPSDRPYCSVDGDIFPEIYYGRFSATNATQLQAILDKTMMYDQYTMPDPSYLAQCVLIAGVDANFGAVWANGQINYATRTYFNGDHGIQPDVHMYPQSGSQDALIVSEVSQGRGFVNYTAHGSQTSWGDPTFTQSNINNLQNAGKYCLAIGNCCQTSMYDYAECFGETFLRAADKGAIGYIGGANNTQWNEDYWWAVGYRSTVVANPTYDAEHQGAYDGMFHDHGEVEGRWYVTQDAIVFCGNLAVQESGSGSATYYWNIYNLLGDPSISPYFMVPQANDVTHVATLDPAATTMSVAAAPGSYVGLTQAGQLLGAGTVHEGESAVEITFLAPLATEAPVKLVVMAQHRVPYVVEIPVAGTTAAPDALPPAPTLEGNTPNPFNPETVIRYTTPAAQPVQLAVFDLRGQRIVTLVDDMVTAGRHEARWDGRDAAGRPVTSGTYFYRLDAAGRSLIGRMLLVK